MAPEAEDKEELLVMGRIAKMVHGNKNTRRKFLRLVKEVDPETPIAELEAEDVLEARIKPIQDENAELRKKIEQGEAMKDLENRRTPLRNKLRAQKLPEDQIEKMILDTEKVMIEKKIGDYEIAFDYKTRNESVAAPAKAPFTPVSLPTVVDANFFKDPAAGARNLAAQYFAEKR
jgi:hypothetical protein